MAVLKFYKSLEAVLIKLSGCFSVTSSSSVTLRQVQLAVDEISKYKLLSFIIDGEIKLGTYYLEDLRSTSST